MYIVWKSNKKLRKFFYVTTPVVDDFRIFWFIGFVDNLCHLTPIPRSRYHELIRKNVQPKSNYTNNKRGRNSSKILVYYYDLYTFMFKVCVIYLHTVLLGWLLIIWLLFSKHFLILVGMLWASFWNRNRERSLTHIILIALSSLGRKVMVWSLFNLAFLMDHTYSIKFRSGEFPGQPIGAWTEHH